MWRPFKTLKRIFNKFRENFIEQNIKHAVYKWLRFVLIVISSLLPEDKICRNIVLGMIKIIIYSTTLYGQVKCLNYKYKIYFYQKFV